MKRNNNQMQPERRQLVGVLFTAISALALEIVLTRIFSVTMWYHFAFLAISMALMGSAIAGIALYFVPGISRPQQAQRWMGWAALALAVCVPLTFVIYLHIPVNLTLGRSGGLSAQQIGRLALIYLDLTVPFFLSGVILSLAMSAWSEHSGRVYWADLSGAALGCLFSIVILETLGGAGALLAIGAVAALAGLAFTWKAGRAQIVAAVVVLATIGLVAGNALQGWITISVNKAGGQESTPAYERWNAHSRVTVYEITGYPFFWAVSHANWEKTVQGGYPFRHRLLLIDAIAGTPIQEFHGELGQVEFLRYDLTAFVYHLIDSPQTLVIGPGGGRDVLAALASGAPHVEAVEVNPAVVEAVRGPFADFAGHLYERGDVTVAVDDARGYIARSPKRYDVIQASLIDTWAAGGSGAFALSENSLYTVEAFKTYYEHLSDRGILTISRWYLTERPAETMRLVSTGLAGWASAGVADPRLHIAVVAKPNPTGQSEGMSTALFKRAPFTPQEIETLQARAAELGFTVIYAPGAPPQEEVGRFVAADNHADLIAAYPLDISPATDDRPFFFNLVRLGDLLDPSLSASGVYRTSMEAIIILAAVMLIMLVMGVLFVIIPLWVGVKRRKLARPSAWLLAYFAALGVGFMLVEVPTIQRLTVYLGRPVYSLAIVLFSLLLFSGLGSLSSERLVGKTPAWPARLFPLLAALALAHAVAGAWLLHATMNQPFAVRLAMTVILLAPLSLMMGMPFPLGIRWAGAHWPGVIPWLWGINGVTSVLGSALAIALAIHVGFQITLVIAAAVYGLAGVALHREMRQAL